jgi:hypothetical protein
MSFLAKPKKYLLASAVAVTLMPVVPAANAANWLMLQGTEAPNAAPTAQVWGFIQAQYEADTSTACPAGTAQCNEGYIPPKLIGPNLTSQSSFNVNRARIGVRGQNFPLDSKVNYFFLAEFGNNGLTSKSGSAAKLTDASITLNHIPGVRTRAGLFKTPGPEEALQAIHVFDWVNFSEVTNQLMLERFPNRTHVAANNPPYNPALTSTSQLDGFDRPVSGFRDVGIQVFDAFRFGSWEHSYALMIGNGNGTDMTDIDNHKDAYAYLSTERLFGGEGPKREGVKFFVWAQSGKRKYDSAGGDGIYETYDRKRSGLGVKYVGKPFKFGAEYMQGTGMIFNGPDKPTWALTNAGISNPDAPDNGLKADGSGWYADGGWSIPGTNLEFDLRYDLYHRLDGSTYQLDWKTWTVGLQYYFNPKTRLTFNWATRDINAPNQPGAGTSATTPNNNLVGIDQRYSLQLTTIF